MHKFMLCTSNPNRTSIVVFKYCFLLSQLRRLWILTSWVSWWSGCLRSSTRETGFGVGTQNHSESCSFVMVSVKDSSRKWVWPVMNNNHIHSTIHICVLGDIQGGCFHSSSLQEVGGRIQTRYHVCGGAEETPHQTVLQ